MNRRYVHVLGALLLCTAPLAAQNPPAGAPARPAAADTGKKETDFVKLVKGTTARTGFFDTYEKADKLFLAIPKDRLNKDFLITFEIAQGIGASSLFGGTMLNIFEGTMVAFERHGDKIYLVQKNTHYTATPGTPMARAVDLSYGTSILQSAKVEATRDDSAVVIDTYPWWVSDLSDIGSIVRFAVAPRPGTPGRATFDATRSFLDGVKSFPKNVNVRAKLTFQPGEPVGLQTVGDSRYVPVSIHYSMVALPEVPMTPRLADDRMGYFLTVHKNFSRDDKTYFERFVNKWRLECAGPATNGLCDPKQPIIYYIDRTVPEELRQFVTAGVEAWNKGFEEAGFRHAIRADILPDSADAEDIRFHTIRWNTSDLPGYGAIGPSVVDPRTGEVLDADILFESSFIQGFRNQWSAFVNPAQALQAVLGTGDTTDNNARIAMGGEIANFGALFASQGSLIRAALADRGIIGPNDPVPLAYVGEGLKWATMHEVGHTLGLRHNFKSSVDTPLDSLYSKPFAERNGLYSSVMEYPAPNVPPTGKPIGYFYTPGAGSEDRWVIAYGYTPDSARAASLARQGAQAGHALGTDEDGQTPGSMDPSTSIYDLSSDPLGWAKQRTALVKSLIPKLPTSALADNSPGVDLTGALGNMLNQYAQAVAYAVKYVGGQYTFRDHRGDPNARAPFVNVPRAKQKEALDFLTAAAFGDTAFTIPTAVLTQMGANRWSHWGNNSTYLNGRIDYPLHEQILGVQTGLLARLTTPILFARIRDAETKFGAGNVVTIPELVQQLTQATWSEVFGPTKNISAARRDLQRAYLDRMSDIVATPPAGMPADARSVVRYRLMDLRSKINGKLAAPAALDGYTVAHLTDAKARIDHALEAGLDVEKGR